MSKAFRNTLLAISLTYIVLGLIQILWPVGSRMVICYIMGAALTLFGIYHIVRYFSADTSYMFPGMGLALGVACTVTGILMIICAKAVVAIFGVVLGIAVISDSILRMQLSFNMMRFGIGRYGICVHNACGGHSDAVQPHKERGRRDHGYGRLHDGGRHNEHNQRDIRKKDAGGVKSAPSKK